jgi:hypothetical protein
VKERPVVRYVDLPVYGTAMSLTWKKHRMRCTSPGCAKRGSSDLSGVGTCAGVTHALTKVLQA